MARDKAPRSTEDELNLRRARFWKLLAGEGAESGKPVPYSMFVATARELGQQISERACQHTLQGMREANPYPGTRLIVAGDGARLERFDDNVFADRYRKVPDLKRRLGDVLWSLLFGVESNVNYDIEGNFDAQGRLRRKIAATRLKSPVSMFMDAGSTNLLACEQLLAIDSMPLRVPRWGADSDEACRLVSLNLMTNCPKMATMIGDSRHRDDIGVIVIGGDQRSQRGSLCGTLSQMWIAATNPCVDVSIVGATAYRYDLQGRPALGSDHVEEAQIKGTFLTENRAWFRVSIFDSGKTEVAKAVGVSRAFAAITPENLDLIVTDDGVRSHDSFLSDVGDSGVAIAILRSARDDSASVGDGGSI